MVTREVFFNVGSQGQLAFYALAGVASLIFFAGMVRIAVVWASAWGEQRDRDRGEAIRRMVLDGLLGRQIFRGNVLGGTAHFFLSWGWVFLFIGTVLLTIHHDLRGFLYGITYLVYSLALDLSGALLIAGTLMLAYRRFVTRANNVHTRWDDPVYLVLLFVIAATGFLVEGTRIWSVSTVGREWSPVGDVVGMAIDGGTGSSRALHGVLWWVHALASLGLIAYIPYSKLFHMFGAAPNLYLASARPGVLTVEEREQLRSEFDRTEFVSMDACMRCNRCEVVCPSNAAGEPLSPRELVQQAKGYARGQYAPDRGRFRDMATPPTLEAVATAGGAWYCTTCLACYDRCPVGISGLDFARDTRAALVESARGVPRQIRDVLGNVARHGNPWEPRGAKHFAWLADLELKNLSEGQAAPLCYYAGNLPSGDERNHQVAKALAKVFRAARLDVGILGREEPYYGEEVRRMGEDGLFETLVEANYQTFAEFQVKDVVTTNPHAYHAIVNDYPRLKGKLKLEDAPSPRVRHHAQLLAGLLREGTLRMSGKIEKRVGYHDPCYLGRHNEVYDAPREVLKALPGVEFVELPRSGRDSFCCGGGGGRMWLESNAEHRISELRARDAMKAGVDIMVTACPYCMSNLTDGMKVIGESDRIEVKDLAELVADAL